MRLDPEITMKAVHSFIVSLQANRGSSSRVRRTKTNNNECSWRLFRLLYKPQLITAKLLNQGNPYS